MIALNNIAKAYFIGIGGIGMSAIARHLAAKGVQISGYDKTPSVLTDKLIAEGIAIHFEDDVSLAPKDVDVVVYTPAIPKDHSELNHYRDNGYTVMKRSEILGLITEGNYTIAVAGSHGKTTVSSMIAHILKHSGYDCSAFLGGIATNFNSNYVSGERKTVVVEADEFDRSFHKLAPNIALVTAIDTDHLDVYGDLEGLKNAYREFTAQLSEDGILIQKAGLDKLGDNPMTYTIIDGQKADYRGENIKVRDGQYIFDLETPHEEIYSVKLGMPGIHNVENAVAAAAVADQLGISVQAIEKALAEFKGIKRRFEKVYEDESVTYIDDYAHHPEEIRALLASVKLMFPKKRSLAVFQPHLFSRTKDLAEGFAHSLDMADEIILLDIYPARELPMEGVTSALIANKMSKNATVLNKTSLVNELANRSYDVLLTVGAGDIDRLVQPVKEMLENR